MRCSCRIQQYRDKQHHHYVNVYVYFNIDFDVNLDSHD
jgi:hypothetical protein